MRAHPWLTGVDWARVASQQQEPPPSRGLGSGAALCSTLTDADVARIISTEKAVTILPPDQQALFQEYVFIACVYRCYFNSYLIVLFLFAVATATACRSRGRKAMPGPPIDWGGRGVLTLRQKG
jgi:hypothetical protein